MKILFAASEVAPIIKLGGLGDVASSLPKALSKIDVEVDVVVPYFSTAKIEGLYVYKSLTLAVPFKEKSYLVDVYCTKLPSSDVDVFLLKCDEVFSQGGVSAFENIISETQLFEFFSRSVVELIKSKFNTYDLIHCNDWHTALITQLLEEYVGADRPATLLTVHNLFYQGQSDLSLYDDLGLDLTSHSLIDWDLQDGRVSLLAQGVGMADFVSTVSPSYAKEILTPEFGGDLAEVLQNREARLIGILNGVDYSVFPRSFGLTDWQTGKETAKNLLFEKLEMEKSEKPLFSFVARLDPGQKGLDILYENIEYILKSGGSFVLLGSGDKDWEKRFGDQMADLQKKYGKRIHVELKFSTSLATDIYAASDFFFVPSKYEPCGLTQLIAMWYGAVPIVRSVGGLKDSVKEGKTGFLFVEYEADALLKCIKKAFNVYESPLYKEMVEAGMSSDFSFTKTAPQYKDLYQKIIQIRAETIEWNTNV